MDIVRVQPEVEVRPVGVHGLVHQLVHEGVYRSAGRRRVRAREESEPREGVPLGLVRVRRVRVGFERFIVLGIPRAAVARGFLAVVVSRSRRRPVIAAVVVLGLRPLFRLDPRVSFGGVLRGRRRGGVVRRRGGGLGGFPRNGLGLDGGLDRRDVALDRRRFRLLHRRVAKYGAPVRSGRGTRSTPATRKICVSVGA